MKWPKFILNDNAFSCRWKKHQIWSRELSCWTVNPGTQSIQELSHQSSLLQKTHFLHFPSYPKRASKTCISSHRHFSSRSGEAAHFPGMKTLCVSVLLWGMIVETVPKDVFLLSGHWCRTLTIRDQSFGKDIRGVFAESGDTLYLLWWLESSPDKQGLCFFSEVAFELSQRELNYFTFDCDPGFQMLFTALHCISLQTPIFSYATVKKLIWNITLIM